MPLSTDVNLPKKHEAIFPERCVRCGCDPEGRSIRVWTSSIGWWTAVFWMFGRGFTARIPACRSCGWRIRVQRVGGIWVFLYGFSRALPRRVRAKIASEMGGDGVTAAMFVAVVPLGSVVPTSD